MEVDHGFYNVDGKEAGGGGDEGGIGWVIGDSDEGRGGNRGKAT